MIWAAAASAGDLVGLAARASMARQLQEEKENNYGLVEVAESKDPAYFKAQLLDINAELRQYFVR